MNAFAWLGLMSLILVLATLYRAAWHRAREGRDAYVAFDATFRVPNILHGEGEAGSFERLPRYEAPASFLSDAPTTFDIAAAVRRELAGRGYPLATVRVDRRAPTVFVAEVAGVPVVTLRSAEARLEERLPPDVDCELRVGMACH